MMSGISTINAEIFGVRIDNIATGIGAAIDKLTDGPSYAEEVGRVIDEFTDRITIVIGR